MSFKSLIKTVAPVLGGMIGGPFGSLAAKAVSSVLMPGQQNPTDDDLTIALSHASPDKLAELKRIDTEYRITLAQIEASDRSSARAREVALKDKMPSVITFIVVIGFFGILGMLFFDHISPKNSEIIDILIGSLSTVFIQIVSYYFGGNLFSKERKWKV